MGTTHKVVKDFYRLLKNITSFSGERTLNLYCLKNGSVYLCVAPPEGCLITSPLKQILFPVGCPCPSLNCVNLCLSEWAENNMAHDDDFSNIWVSFGCI